MKIKITEMKRLVQDADYLSGEYESIKLWGNAPDGEVPFTKMMQWLSMNKDVAEHMIKISAEIDALK